MDNLNVSTRCGCSPRARQTRCTVSRLTPTRAAIVRVDQCVAPGGVSCTVTGVTATAAAICTFGSPSAAISSACARRTSRYAAVVDRASTSNVSR